MRTLPSERWVRGTLGEVSLVDDPTPLLAFEDHFPIPFYAHAPSSVSATALVETEPPPASRGFDFFAPKSAVRRWFDVVVGEERIGHAAWELEALPERIVLGWRPGTGIRFTEEDEVVFGHPRDPFHRVDALPSSRHVVVSAGGKVLADTRRPTLVFETMLPTRFYVPEEDVHWDALRPAESSSMCPYKGVADRYWDVVGDDDLARVAWSYPDPKPAVRAIAGLVAFYDESVDVTVDGVLRERPVSVFSDKAQRPAEPAEAAEAADPASHAGSTGSASPAGQSF